MPDEATIFNEARRIDDLAARDRYLAQVCGGDTSVHARIESLLNVHDQQASFLASPAVDLDGATSLDPSMFFTPPGTVIGRYKLLEPIGEGGYGTVFMAEQSAPVHRRVALKIIKAGMDTKQVIARFEAERQALALMDHPHIAKVFDAGMTDAGRPYFVMELVKGVSIIKYCDAHHLPPRARLELFVQVCQAVQHAHTKGIIHRDIKASNVLVALCDGKPVPRVIDFGVAKATGQQLTERTMFTGLGDVIGTPQYMSPEQAEVNQLDVDTRSDIYSLGVLLYELLTGSTPLENKRVRNVAMLEMLRMVREEDAPRPSTRLRTSEELPLIAACRGLEPRKLSGQVHGELDWIVMKALEKNRDRRYQTADGMAKDVQRYLDDEAVQACPPSAWYRFHKFAQRNKRALMSAAVLALAALIGVAALATSTVLVSRANTDLSASLIRERAATDLQRREAYFQRITVAHRELSTDSRAAALRALEECPEDLRAWEWYYLMRLCKVEPLIIPDGTEVSGVAFSPNGDRLASAGGDGMVKIRNSRTGQLIQEFRAHDKGASSVAYHPDGLHLASAGADGLVKVWHLPTGREVFRGPCDALRKFGAGYTVAFSPPDGRRLAAGSGGAVRVWDWRKNQPGVPEHVLSGHESHSVPVTFSDDGGRLATGGVWQGQNIYDAATGRHLRTGPAHQHPVTALAFSPGGKLLATGSLGRTVKLWDTTTGQLLHECPHNGNVLGVAFNLDGERLFSACDDKAVRVWDVRTGREVLGLREHTDSIGCVAFSPQGARLASASLDGTIRLWDATPLRNGEGEETTFARHKTELRSIAVDPDGKRIASAGHGGVVKIWDTANTQKLLEIPSHAVLVWSVAWDPDGQRIAAAGSDGLQLAVKVWDARSGRERFTIRAEGEKFGVPFMAVAFGPNPDGHYLVTGKQNGAVHVWDALTGKPVQQLGAHDREVRGVVFSPNGQHLATASGDGQIMLWDAARLDEAQSPRLPPLRARVPGQCLNVAFSPDSQRLASGGTGNTVKIWDVQTGEESQILHGHRGDVYTVAFSPHDGGRWIASGGEDSTVKIWDSRTGKEVLSFHGHTGLVCSLAFSPDGKRLYSGSRDTKVKVWNLTALNHAASMAGGK